MGHARHTMKKSPTTPAICINQQVNNPVPKMIPAPKTCFSCQGIARIRYNREGRKYTGASRGGAITASVAEAIFIITHIFFV